MPAVGFRLWLLASFSALFATAATPASTGAETPPVGAGCGPNGPTRSATPPTAALASSTILLRDTGRIRMLVRGNQTAGATVVVSQAGGRRVGGTDGSTYTCIGPGTEAVALPLNAYGRALVRRHRQLRVLVRMRLVNGSGVGDTVALTGTVRADSHRGVAPLWVPDARGRMHRSKEAHVAFALPPGRWVLPRTDSHDLVRNGSYQRTTTPDDRKCGLTLGVGGQGQRNRPVLRLWGKSAQVRRGTSGDLRWLAGLSTLPPSGPSPYAGAYGRAPVWLGVPWSSFELGVQAPRSATAACRRSMLRLDLAAVARSVRVARGPLPGS